MKDIDIIKLIKLIKKQKKVKKVKKAKAKLRQQTGTQLDRVATLRPSIISTGLYDPSFHTQQIYSDPNKRESENFIEYKKTRGILPAETRNNLPSEIELYKEYEKIKKLSKADIQFTLDNKNIKSQALERQKYLDVLLINEERRLQKEQVQLAKQALKTKTKIKGIRTPIVFKNKIVPDQLVGFSLDDGIDVGTAIGGTSDEFIVSQSQDPSQVEGPSIISVGGSSSKNKRGRPKKVLNP
jgi:hypothetical protein